ncbi:MAG: hypothetical protein ACJAWS_001600 [Oleiphilaceae bacterium]
MKVAGFIKFILGVSLIGILVSQLDFSLVFTTLSESMVSYLYLVVVFYLLATFFEVLRVYVLLKDFFSFFQVAAVVFIGVFFNNFLPSSAGGDFYKIYSLKKAKVAIEKGVVLVLFDRLMGVLVLVVFGVLYSLINTKIFSGFVNKVEGFTPGISLEYFLIAAGVILLCTYFLRGAIKGYYNKVSSKIEQAIIFLKSFPPERYVIQFSLAACFHLARLFAIYYLVLSLNGYIVWHNIIFLLTIVTLISALPISFGGLGVREGLLAGGLMVFGVEANVAISVALINLSYLWLKALTGAFCLLGVKISAENRKFI